jgi:pyridoxamine 5'-phosphate oxidase
MSSDPNLSALRKEYSLQELTFEKTAEEPMAQFNQWFQEALQAQLPEPNAMHIATVSKAGKPSGRIVLLKDIETEGFVFYTNYQSRKGLEIAENPWVSLTFFWPELERQVRIEGKTEMVSAQQSEAYFHTRPRASQLGAIASPQSQIIHNRSILEKNLTSLQEQFGDAAIIPRPTHWGGYCVKPDKIEFWQGRRSRLHDRIQYVRQENGLWLKQRLAP